MKIQKSLQPVLSQKLGAQGIQLITFLQCNALQLEELLSDTVLDNPYLTLDPAEVLRNRKDDRRPSFSPPLSENLDLRDPFQNIAAQEALDLYDHLFIQLAVSRAAPQVKKAAARLISYLDTSGRLISSIPVIAAAFDMPVHTLEEALRLIQSFEPAGVGARDLSECLSLQLERLERNDPYAREIVQNHLEDMAKGNDMRIAEKLGTTERQVRQSCKLIRSLNPRPCAAFQRSAPVPYVVPDAWAEFSNGRWNLYLYDDILQRLRYNTPALCKHAEEDREAAAWLDEKKRDAKRIFYCVQKRQETLMNLLQFLLDYQSDNAKDPARPLRPLLLSDVSRAMGIHLSTASRMVQGKCITMAYGTRTLQSFLSKRHAASGQSMDKISVSIADFIAKEDRAHPLSDAMICDRLQKMGVAVARRTVAKYRENLGIPCASMRKKNPAHSP